MPSPLEHHAELTAELADLLEERGMVQAAAITTRAATFTDSFSSGMNITTVREMASANAAPYEAEIANLTGRIDARRARLTYFELRLANR